MIELPEAMTIAQQITQELKGKQIICAVRNKSPHKFAFTGKYSHEEFAELAKNKKIGTARADGSVILVHLEPNHVLSLGCGGERILYHTHEKTLPKKHQLLFNFGDNTYFTVTVSGWGEVRLMEQSDIFNHPHIKKDAVSPLSNAFNFSYFNKLFDTIPEKRVSVKYFIISEPGIWGIGNGCLQDILYKSKIHPKRQVKTLSQNKRQTLYKSIKDTLTEMVALGGRDSEYDLYDNPGQYQRILHSKTVGNPCQKCGTPIKKAQYLGGSIYFCPVCQRESPGQ